MRRLLRAVPALLACLGSLALAGTARAQGSIPDGSSNTILIGEHALGGTGCTVATTLGGFGDGSVRSIYLRPTAGVCGLPFAPASCPVARQPITRVLDGSSNTVYVAETPGTWCLGPVGSGKCAVKTLPGIQFGDGSSNTVLIGELLPPVGGPEPLECALPVGEAGCAISGPTILDGTSNTITLGYTGTGRGCLLPVAGTRDLPDIRVDAGGSLCSPTPGGIRDGSSNTILVGECVAAVATPEPTTGALAAAGLLVLVPAAVGAARRRRGA